MLNRLTFGILLFLGVGVLALASSDNAAEACHRWRCGGRFSHCHVPVSCHGSWGSHGCHGSWGSHGCHGCHGSWGSHGCGGSWGSHGCGGSWGCGGCGGVVVSCCGPVVSGPVVIGGGKISDKIEGGSQIGEGELGGGSNAGGGGSVIGGGGGNNAGGGDNSGGGSASGGGGTLRSVNPDGAYIPDSSRISPSAIARAAAQTPPTSKLAVSARKPAPARVVNAEAASYYFSQGYHAYWNRDYRTALRYLNKAMQASNVDARVWYYKGFTEIALRQERAALDSLAQAVRLHMNDSSQAAKVSKSLERVQGSLRLRIYQAKLRARALQNANPSVRARLAKKN